MKKERGKIRLEKKKFKGHMASVSSQENGKQGREG